MEMMVAAVGFGREADQLVAVEALIHASRLSPRHLHHHQWYGVSLLKEIYKTTKTRRSDPALVVSGLGTRPCTRYQGCQNEWDGPCLWETKL